MNNYYFASDGNWGDATDLVQISDGEVHPHFFEVVGDLTDSDRLAYAKWFRVNDHDPEETTEQYGFSSGVCEVCDSWDTNNEDEDEDE